MKALSISPEEFLQPFFDPSETVCLRVFDDKKCSTFKGMKLESRAGQIGGLLDTFHPRLLLHSC